MNYQKKCIILLIGIILFSSFYNKSIYIENLTNEIEHTCPNEQSNCPETFPNEKRNCWNYDAVSWACGVTKDQCKSPAPFKWCGDDGGGGGDDDGGGGDDDGGGGDEVFLKGICYQTSFTPETSPQGRKEFSEENLNLNGRQYTEGFAADIAANLNWTSNNDWSICEGVQNDCGGNIRKRGDIDTLKNAGVNATRIYNWGFDFSDSNSTGERPEFQHTQFLDDLDDNDIKFMLPVNNYFCFEDGYTSYLNLGPERIIKEITKSNKYRKCIHSISFSNEPDLYMEEGKNIDWIKILYDMIKKYIDKENELNTKAYDGTVKNLPKIVIPLSFGPNGTLCGKSGDGGRTLSECGAILMYKKLKDDTDLWDKIKDRYIVGINAFTDITPILNEFSNNYKDGDSKLPYIITEWFGQSKCAENIPCGGEYASGEKSKQALLEIMNKRNDHPELKGVFTFIFQQQIDKDYGVDEDNIYIVPYDDWCVEHKKWVDDRENIKGCKADTTKYGNFGMGETAFGLTKFKTKEDIVKCVKYYEDQNNYGPCPDFQNELCDNDGRFEGLAQAYGGSSNMVKCTNNEDEYSFSIN